jgi:putative transcriptional regulator
MKSFQAQLLVAAPSLDDPNFNQTVVLILVHTDQGAFGLVLNRPTDISVKKVWQSMEETSSCVRREPLYWGGPVSQRICCLHTTAGEAQEIVLPGVYFAVNRDSLRNVLRKKTGAVRMFNGFAGWGPGQLESEIADGGWLTLPASPELTFFNPDELWQRTLNDIGEGVLRPLLGKSPLPPNPSVN